MKVSFLEGLEIPHRPRLPKALAEFLIPSPVKSDARKFRGRISKDDRIKELESQLQAKELKIKSYEIYETNLLAYVEKVKVKFTDLTSLYKDLRKENKRLRKKVRKMKEQQVES